MKRELGSGVGLAGYPVAIGGNWRFMRALNILWLARLTMADKQMLK